MRSITPAPGGALAAAVTDLDLIDGSAKLDLLWSGRCEICSSFCMLWEHYLSNIVAMPDGFAVRKM